MVFKLGESANVDDQLEFVSVAACHELPLTRINTACTALLSAALTVTVIELDAIFSPAVGKTKEAVGGTDSPGLTSRVNTRLAEPPLVFVTDAVNWLVP